MQIIASDRIPSLLRLVRTFEQLLFILPTIILFYKFKGLTAGDFFLIQGLHNFATFALEIPTGYIADLFSRRKVIVLSTFTWFLGNLMMFTCDNFMTMLAAELVFSLSISLYSGTTEAYLFDALKQLGREKDMLKEQSKVESYSIMGTAFATFIGGVMYQYLGPDITMLATVAATFIAFTSSLLLPELNEEKRIVEQGKSKIKDIMEITAYASRHHEIKWLMLFPAIYGAGTLALFWSLQPLMEMALIPTFMFGILVGSNQFLRSLFAHYCHNMFKILKIKKYTLLFFSIVICGMAAAAVSAHTQFIYMNYAFIIIVCIAAASQVSLRIAMSTLINQRIRTDERATILSVNSMFSKVFCSVAMISLKFLIDHCGIGQTMLIIGAFVLLGGGYSLIRLLNLKIE